MISKSPILVERRQLDPTLIDRYKAGHPKPLAKGTFRSLGLGLITGAADDDPSAIGTYAAAGASIGPSFLWTAPVTFPMMFSVVYLCSKLGQVAGQGLFAVIRAHYSRWLLYFFLITAVVGNIIEAGADLGGMAAALNVIVPVPIGGMVILLGISVLSMQLWGYTLIRNIFRWLALALLAYVGSAIIAKPELLSVIKGTFIPTIHFNKDFFAMLVAVIGTTREELRHSRRDVAFGMFFSNLVMFFIILSTAATLFKVGKTDINTAAEAAQALRPLAGSAAGLLFALGVVGVGFLAVPVMTIGAAFDLCQSFGWKHGLHARPKEAKPFYAAVVVFTLLAMALNFFGINPMKALVYAGIVQGFSTPFLMLLVMLITNNRKIMGKWVNGRAMNILGWITTAAMFAAAIGLIATLFI